MAKNDDFTKSFMGRFLYKFWTIFENFHNFPLFGTFWRLSPNSDFTHFQIAYGGMVAFQKSQMFDRDKLAKSGKITKSFMGRFVYKFCPFLPFFG